MAVLVSVPMILPVCDVPKQKLTMHTRSANEDYFGSDQDDDGRSTSFEGESGICGRVGEYG